MVEASLGSECLCIAAALLPCQEAYNYMHVLRFLHVEKLAEEKKDTVSSFLVIYSTNSGIK
jgi:hypothetical protein